MTEQEMQIAVAESIGWTGCFVATGKEEWLGTFAAEYEGRLLGFKPWADDSAYDVPNYPQDLNAMNEVEKGFDAVPYTEGWQQYFLKLIEVTQNTYIDGKKLITATAHQRCEAYLRVKGLWK